MNRAPARFALAVLLLSLGACKRPSGSAVVGDPAVVAAPTAAPAATAGALHPVGMIDPFARLTTDSAKALNAGFAALKAKQWDDARAAFAKVTAVTPDYTAAWYQQARAAALGGHFADAVDLWSELLARDFVAYAGRLDKPADMKLLRAAPEWARIQDLETKYKVAYAAGLLDTKGFFFVARAREADKPKPGKKEFSTILELRQEVYRYDLASQRYRRLTETGGHVYAINLSPDRKLLAFYTATGIEPQGEGNSFVPAKGGAVDLVTLETTGPFAASGAGPEIAFLNSHDPVWLTVNGDVAQCFDTAKTALIECPNVPEKVRANGVTSFDDDDVIHAGATAVSDVKIDADGTSITVPGSDQPLRVARKIDAASLDWSPGKKRLSYSGSIHGCDVIKAGKAAEKNELFVWDSEKKTATRVAHAVATFETLWLDDDHLVYEGGVGKEGRLHIYDFTTRSDTTLAPRAGAGLYGYPAMLCQPGEGEDVPTDTEQNP